MLVVSVNSRLKDIDETINELRDYVNDEELKKAIGEEKFKAMERTFNNCYSELSTLRKVYQSALDNADIEVPGIDN